MDIGAQRLKELDKLKEIWLKMNDDERWGCRFGLFPIWVTELQLPMIILQELQSMSEGGARYPEQSANK